MKVYNKKEAIKEIEKLANETIKLANQKGFSKDHARWVIRTTSFLEDVFGQNSIYYQNFTSFTWKLQGQAIIGGPSRRREVMDPQLGIDRVDHEAYLKQLESAEGLLLAAKDELQKKDIESVYKGKNTGPEASILFKIINLTEHKLRKIVRNKPSIEKDIQDAFENLLIGADISYSQEADSIEYSTKTYIPDFTIVKADLAIDIKLCSSKKREKVIIAEINDDILAYKTKYGNIMFIVYDLSIIRDVERFIDNFQKHEGVIVKVVKH